MPRFAANLSLMFNEVDFLDRFEAAAKAGFGGIEYLFPYDYEPAAIKERLEKHGLTQVLFNLHPGDWAGGERGLTSLPDRVAEFQDSVGQAIDYAKALGCTMLHALPGVPGEADRDRVDRTYVENLRFAAEAAKVEGIRILIEPINTRDMPGIYLNRSSQALSIMEEVGSDNLYLQYDCYHMQIMEGDLTTTIERILDKIAHIQIAEVPGRHEPGRGEIAYDFVFEHLDRIGYSGWIGCEYRPAGNTVEGLGWFKPYARR
jgi:hydroxypyruvate isomerase